MMFVELSYDIDEQIPTYPGLPRDRFTPHTRMANGDESNTTLITHFLHNGTHVDVSFHFDDKGATIDQIPIEDFIFDRPLVIHQPLGKSELIQLEHLNAFEDALYQADILMFCTDYCRLRAQADLYSDDFPSVSRGAAEFIRTQLTNLKAVAIDTLSIESATLGPQEDFKIHKTFLDSQLYDTKPLLVYEDVNVGRIVDRSVRAIYAFPLRLKGLDASPVTMVAEIAEESGGKGQ